MPGLRDALRRAGSLFVVTDPVATSPSTPPTDDDVADLFARYGGITPEQAAVNTPGLNLDEVQITGTVTPAEDGTLDYQAIYEAAGIEKIPFTVEQAIGLIGALPQTMTKEMKQQSVLASIGAMGGAMGVTAEMIVADCARKLAAMNAYLEKLDVETEEFTRRSQEEIRKLETQIEGLKHAVLKEQTLRDSAHQQCDREADRIDNIYDYLGSHDPAPPDASPDSSPDSSPE